jgi:hypothetical protein
MPLGNDRDVPIGDRVPVPYCPLSLFSIKTSLLEIEQNGHLFDRIRVAQR